MLRHRAESRRGIRSLGDDLEVACALENHPQPRSHDPVIVGEDDRYRPIAGRHCASASEAERSSRCGRKRVWRPTVQARRTG
jgi:hypothetical protein